jgi:AraC family transcriptional regulator
MNRRTRPATLRFYKEGLLRVMVHIQQHLDEPLPWQDLAHLACLSPYHFHHIFTGMTGESLSGHIRRLRLERAATRLKLSSDPIVDIAFEAGYANHESFTRAFHAAFGVSPTLFRRSRRVHVEIRAPSGIHYQNQEYPTDFRSVRSKPMKVTIKHLSPMRVAFMRHIGPYSEVGRTWDEFMMWLGKEGFLGGDVQFIGICHDDPAVTPVGRIRYDACVTVDGAFRPQGAIGAQVIAGGEYAVLTHFGPYEGLGGSYARLLGQWLPRSGRCVRALPSFEVYFNSPENTAPADLVTDLHVPLEAP